MNPPQRNHVQLSRREFGLRIVKGLAGVSLVGALGDWGIKTLKAQSNPSIGVAKEKKEGSIRIRPLSGSQVSRSFQKFCERNRFTTVTEAVESVRDPSARYEIYLG